MSQIAGGARRRLARMEVRVLKIAPLGRETVRATLEPDGEVDICTRGFAVSAGDRMLLRCSPDAPEAADYIASGVAMCRTAAADVYSFGGNLARLPLRASPQPGQLHFLSLRRLPALKRRYPSVP